MERQSQIHVVEVEHDGHAHEARYFVENDVIRANIDGRMMTLPLGQNPASETVRAMLAGHLGQKSRKLRHVVSWQKS